MELSWASFGSAVDSSSGKVLANRIVPELEAAAEPRLDHDSSTNALIRWYRRARG